MLIDDLSQIPGSLKQGWRCLLLLYRSKDGNNGNAQSKAIKLLSNGSEEWTSGILHLKSLQDTLYPKHRIYSSVNARDFRLAIREFKRRQLDMDYNPILAMQNFYADIENMFFSCIQNPSCRDGNRFLIDCDTEEEYQTALEIIPMHLIIFDYATKNGRHIITEPFNHNEIKVEVKKDDLIAIG